LNLFKNLIWHEKESIIKSISLERTFCRQRKQQWWSGFWWRSTCGQVAVPTVPSRKVAGTPRSANASSPHLKGRKKERMRICDSARIKGEKRVGYGFTDGMEGRWRSVEEVDKIGNNVVALLLRHCGSDANAVVFWICGCSVYQLRP